MLGEVVVVDRDGARQGDHALGEGQRLLYHLQMVGGGLGLSALCASGVPIQDT